MPIYEYECQACGHRQEAMQKMSDDPLIECEACDKPKLKKLISAAGFRLKGGGWYETDFKGSKKKNVTAASSSSTASSATTSTAKPSGGCGSGGCSSC